MTVANPYLYGIQWNERAGFWEICHGPGQPWVKAPHQYKRPKPSDQILGIMGKVGIGEKHVQPPPKESPKKDPNPFTYHDETVNPGLDPDKFKAYPFANGFWPESPFYEATPAQPPPGYYSNPPGPMTPDLSDYLEQERAFVHGTGPKCGCGRQIPPIARGNNFKCTCGRIASRVQFDSSDGWKCPQCGVKNPPIPNSTRDIQCVGCRQAFRDGNTPKVSVTFPDLGGFKWGWKCPRCSYDNPTRETDLAGMIYCSRCGMVWPS